MRGATDVPDYSLRHVTFQSTLLMRGATTAAVFSSSATMHFNPRSSCEERQQQQGRIEITDLFQSTLLMRGATLSLVRAHQVHGISIHAPHARSDGSCWRQGRRSIFQSTLLMRGATLLLPSIAGKTGHFNPRSSCEERPAVMSASWSGHANFNPRSSCEERLTMI